MTIVLFTEDGPTGAAISILAEKVLSSAHKKAGLKRRQIKRGDIFKNPRKIAALVSLNRKQGNAKIIVCVDSECTDPAETERNLTRCRNHLKKARLAADIIVVVHALETWLAADQNALRSAFNITDGIKIPGNLETICRPADMLKKLIRKHGGEFVKSKDDLKIANHANPEEIAKRCASFVKFQKILLSR